MSTLDDIDPTFVDDLRDSDRAVQIVGEWLRRDKRLDVWVRPIETRPTLEERRDYADKGDIRVTLDGKTWRVEVKHRPDIAFQVGTWPWRTVIVDNVHAYDLADPKPDVYYSCNQAITCAVRIPVKQTREYWEQFTRNNKGRDRYTYECDIARLTYVGIR